MGSATCEMTEVTQSLVSREAGSVAIEAQPEAAMRRKKERCQINTCLMDRAVESKK